MRHHLLRRHLTVALVFPLIWIGLGTGTAHAAASFPNSVVPVPVSETASGTTFTLTSAATIGSDVANVGTYLAGILRASTGYAVPAGTGTGTITLSLSGAPASVGTEGYQLVANLTSVTIRAQQAAGLFHGVQTLLRSSWSGTSRTTSQNWRTPCGSRTSRPRHTTCRRRSSTSSASRSVRSRCSYRCSS
jgi:hexosaminidase